MLVASVKTEEILFRNKAASDSEVPCFITGMEVEDNQDASAYDRIHSQKIKRITITCEENVTDLSDTSFGIVYSPIDLAS